MTADPTGVAAIACGAMVPDAATMHSVQAAAVSEVDVRSFNVAPGARQGKNDSQKIAEAQPPD